MNVPQPAVNAVHRTSGFVYGAFGKDGPEERFNLCGPFWASVLGLTIGLPVVLLFWGVRLVFGKGRVEKIAAFFDKDWVGKLLTTLMIIVGIGGFVVLPLLAGLLENEWNVFFAVCVSLILAIVVIGTVIGVLEFLDRRKEKRSSSTGKTYRMICDGSPHPSVWEVLGAQVRELLGPLPVLLNRLLLVPFNIVKLFAVMAHATYKRYCPIVEVSY